MHSQVQEAPRLPVLIVLSALAVLPINMFVPSLPNIAKEFNAEFVLVNVAVAGYAVATARDTSDRRRTLGPIWTQAPSRWSLWPFCDGIHRMQLGGRHSHVLLCHSFRQR
jgi:hypothetical protein